MQHNFADSLAVSQDQADWPIWAEVYHKAFPTLDTMTCVRLDGWAQRGGIDRVLTLKSGKSLTIDEKVRQKDYGDVLLEYWSSYESKTPGWIAKDLACDFIAYAVLPASRCYLLPFHTLRKAWKEHGLQWVREHRRVEADNGTYTTVSVAVPVDRLMAGLADAMSIDWTTT